MKKFLLIVLLLTGAISFAQEDAWVYFGSKPDADFYLSNPLEMLSQRALDRREAQNIGLDMLDVPISQTYVDAIDTAPGITVMAKSKWLNAVHVRGTSDAIAALLSFDFVDYVDFADDSLDAANRAATGPKARISKLLDAQADFPYGGSGNQVTMLNGHVLHQQDYTGTGKIIAVMDAGFPGVDVAQPFQRLRDNNQILGGYNFVDRNTDIYSRNSHGTLVLSTMGGYVPDQLVGTAPDSQYYLFITEDTGSENPVEESYWVEAAEAADSLGVDVINTSLGYFLYDDPDYNYTYSDMDGTKSFASRGADIAFSRGMVVVVSAGNSGNSANPNINVPADAVNVLTVGAVDSDGQYVSFSSIGPTADGRVKPDVMAKGAAAVFASPNGNVSTGNGTSFAGPIIAGMVASLWQAVPNKTNAEIVQMIKESAHLYSNPNPQYGYGIPNFALALDNALSVTDFVAFPSPTHNSLYFTFPSDVTSAEVRIFSISGAEVASSVISLDDPQISVDSLSVGIYLYKISGAGKTTSGKFIKH